MSPPRVLVLSDAPADGVTVDVVIAEDPAQLPELRRRRGRACAVSGLPVLLVGASAITPETPATFGSLTIVPATAAHLDDQTRSLALVYREQVRTASERLWQVGLSLALGIVLMAALILFLSNATQRERPDARLKEARAYEDYRRRFGWQQLGPLECRSEAEYRDLDTALTSTLAPPQEYARHWHDTPVVTLFRKWQADAATARQLRTGMAPWYREQARRASLLLDEPRYDAAWFAAAISLLQQPSAWLQQGPIPQSEKLPQRRGMPLTYESIRASDVVQQAAREWQITAWRLTGIPAFQAFLTPLARQAGVWPRWP